MTEITVHEDTETLDLTGDLLPWNYVSASLGDIPERANLPSRILIDLPVGDRPARIATISGKTLSDPVATAAFIAGFKLESPLTGSRLIIGPATDTLENDGTNAPKELTDLVGVPWTIQSQRQFDRALVIIDAGIAFWNDRFRGAQGPRFRGMRYLDFEQPFFGLTKGLNDLEIEGLCTRANDEGNRAMVNHLGGRFPNSVFGKAANPNPEGFWHGTAVADLAAGAAPGEADNVALFGIELPRAVVADYSGEQLTNVLAALLPAAVGMTSDFVNIPVTIVLPLGFPGGPQDGSHPAAEAIRSFVQTTTLSGLKIVIPAGNHLQDRCHARLDTEGSRNMVCWDLPPDDFSENELEIFGKAGEPLRLQIAGPGQDQVVEASLPSPGFRLIVRKRGVTIGRLIRLSDRNGRSRARFILSQTATDASGLTSTPCGRWVLRSDGPDKLDFWLFRDDRDPMADRSHPRRPSRFFSAGYVLRDPLGAPPLGDDPGSAVLRSGTLSVLATAADPRIDVVQANQRYGKGTEIQAAYSGRRQNGMDLTVSKLVDDGWPGRGAAAAANGGQRRVRMSGTSAAAGLRARTILGLDPPAPV